MNIKNITAPYDVYSRHMMVVRVIGSSSVVLDVGGSLKELEKFMPEAKVFTTDVIGGDVISSGKNLPFKSNSVETVVSIDTVEHLPKPIRKEFIRELARVAKDKLIIAAPMGTKAHIKAEKSQLAKQKTSGKKPDQYLSEHVSHGLPQLTEIKSWLQDFPNHKIIFSGNFNISQKLFDLYRSELKLPLLGRFWYQTKKIIFAAINLTLFPLENEVSFSQKVNRFYLEINLA